MIPATFKIQAYLPLLSFALLSFALLSFTDVAGFLQIKGKTLRQQKRLQVTLLQWSGTKLAIAPRYVCTNNHSLQPENFSEFHTHLSKCLNISTLDAHGGYLNVSSKPNEF